MSALILVVVIGLTALSALWSGIVLKILWGWFIVPVFGLPELNLPSAIGIGIVANMLTHQYVPKKEEDYPNLIVYHFYYPTIALVMGFIVYFLYR